MVDSVMDMDVVWIIEILTKLLRLLRELGKWAKKEPAVRRVPR